MDIYRKYSELRREMDTLEIAEAALKAEIMADMEASGKVSDRLEFGSFTVVTKKRYEYTDAVKRLEEAVKMAKFEEQEKKTAKVEESRHLSFKAK